MPECADSAVAAIGILRPNPERRRAVSIGALHRFVRIAGALVIAMSAVGLAGWIFDVQALRSVLPGAATMKINTALALAAAAVALLLAAEEGSERRPVVLGILFALVPLLLGCAVLLEYTFGVDLKIDQALIADPEPASGWSYPGRPSLATAACSVLAGAGLLLLHARNRLLQRAGELLALLVVLIGLLNVVGYLYGRESLYRIAPFSTFAIHTALSFILLATAMLAARPQRSIPRLFASEAAGGALMRRFVPVIVLLPLALAWFRLKGEEIGLYDTRFGVVILVTVWIVVLSVLSWMVAKPLDRADFERQQALEALRRANAELEERVASRTAQLQAANRELEAFAYSVSHDLRAPLRAIDGFSRIVQEDYAGKLDEEGRRLLGVIRHSSRKMGQLIDDLLEYSRLGRKSLTTTEINMRHVAADAIREILAGRERPPKLVLGALPRAPGDATLMKQVWINLLANAVKFSGKREQPVIEVSGHENGAQCVYCVKDNGAGFDMRYHDKLFEVFQRLHREDEFEGTGVGLAIVQRVVARHGGRAWAEGKPGEGAAFYFALPRGEARG